MSLRNGQLCMAVGDDERTVPLEDIDTLVVENSKAVISVRLVAALAEHDVSTLFSDGKHLPCAWLLSTARHSRQLSSAESFRKLTQPAKKRLWQTIVRQKVRNQAAVARCRAASVLADDLDALVGRVKSGDASGVEASAARLYFRELWQGTRRDPHRLNAAANYGYAILRSSLARHLVAHGFEPAYGLFHSSDLNAHNLADDLLEPFRPVVDLKVLAMADEWDEGLGDELTPDDKQRLIASLLSDVPLAGPREGEACSVMDATHLIVRSLRLNRRAPATGLECSYPG